MKAAVFHGVKDVRMEEIDVPEIGPSEVLVKIRAALTCGTDRKMYLRGHPLFKPPFVFGHEFSGDIVKVGSKVKNFKEFTLNFKKKRCKDRKYYYHKEEISSQNLKIEH